MITWKVFDAHTKTFEDAKPIPEFAPVVLSVGDMKVKCVLEPVMRTMVEVMMKDQEVQTADMFDDNELIFVGALDFAGSLALIDISLGHFS
jgi:hypothetical protein